jgi:anaphase-promoting complex subunit 4
MALENSKAVHHISVSQAKISHIAWSRNYIGRRAPKRSSPAPEGSWDRLLSGALDVEHNQDLLDLPHELTFLEVETALPKISPLPVSGGSG